MFNHVDRDLGDTAFERELDRRIAEAFWAPMSGRPWAWEAGLLGKRRVRVRRAQHLRADHGRGIPPGARPLRPRTPPLDAVENEDWGRDYVLQHFQMHNPDELAAAGLTWEEGTDS